MSCDNSYLQRRRLTDSTGYTRSEPRPSIIRYVTVVAGYTDTAGVLTVVADYSLHLLKDFTQPQLALSGDRARNFDD